MSNRTADRAWASRFGVLATRVAVDAEGVRPVLVRHISGTYLGRAKLCLHNEGVDADDADDAAEKGHELFPHDACHEEANRYYSMRPLSGS